MNAKTSQAAQGRANERREIFWLIGAPILAHIAAWMWVSWPIHGIGSLSIAVPMGILGAFVAALMFCCEGYGNPYDLRVGSYIGLVLFLVMGTMYVKIYQKTHPHLAPPPYPAILRIADSSR